MALFGYQDWQVFTQIIHTALRCQDVHAVTREVNGEAVEDFQVSRSCCPFIALNADRNIPAVAEAQNYFIAAIRYEFEDYIEWK